MAGPSWVLALAVMAIAVWILETNSSGGSSSLVPIPTTPGTPGPGSGNTSIDAFAAAIAFAEGYGVPGTIPTLQNNPGDIKDASTGLIRTFATPEDGWNELYRELNLILPGSAAQYGYTPDMSIAAFAAIWTATDPADWASNVAYYLGVNPAPFPGANVQTSVRTFLS